MRQAIALLFLATGEKAGEGPLKSSAMFGHGTIPDGASHAREACTGQVLIASAATKGLERQRQAPGSVTYRFQMFILQRGLRRRRERMIEEGL